MLKNCKTALNLTVGKSLLALQLLTWPLSSRHFQPPKTKPHLKTSDVCIDIGFSKIGSMAFNKCYSERVFYNQRSLWNSWLNKVHRPMLKNFSKPSLYWCTIGTSYSRLHCVLLAKFIWSIRIKGRALCNGRERVWYNRVLSDKQVGMNREPLLILLYPRLCSGILGNWNLLPREERKKRSISRKQNHLRNLLFNMLLSHLLL